MCPSTNKGYQTMILSFPISVLLFQFKKGLPQQQNISELDYISNNCNNRNIMLCRVQKQG